DRRHILHKDVNPAHILLRGDRPEVKLIGFGVATRLLRETVLPQSPDALEGTLAYMSPEQTGRMNRSLDHRSDLYSLGVTLYQMLTGVLPFAASDPLELFHGHIARSARPPHELVRGVPSIVSDIVVKLLSKEPEERYQTAHGLKTDLAACLQQLS